jgi:hypothetical protein
MGTDWCVYGRWVIYVMSTPLAPVGSEIKGISTPNQKGGNFFFAVLIFNEG